MRGTEAIFEREGESEGEREISGEHGVDFRKYYVVIAGNLSFLLVQAATLGALAICGYMWGKYQGMSFSDLMYVTKSDMEKATLDLTKKLQHASDVIDDAKKHLTQRIENLDDKMLKQKELVHSIKDDVGGVRNTLTNFHGDLGILQQTVETSVERLATLSQKQDYAIHCFEHLNDFMPEFLQEQPKLAGNSISLLSYSETPNVEGSMNMVDTLSGGIDWSTNVVWWSRLVGFGCYFARWHGQASAVAKSIVECIAWNLRGKERLEELQGDFGQNYVVIPGKLPSLVVQVATLGALAGYGYMWGKGISFSKTKRNMEKAALDLTKKLQHASDVIPGLGRHVVIASPSMEDSCTHLSQHLPEGEVDCFLWLVTPTQRVVAEGRVYNLPGDTLLNVSLPPDHTRVGVILPWEENAVLPIPTRGARTVGQAVGSFVAWPTNLIVIASFLQSKGKHLQGSRQSKESITTLVKTLPDPKVADTFRVALEKYAAKTLVGGVTRTVEFDRDIYNKVALDEIDFEVVNDVLCHEMIGATSINLYIRYLYHEFLVPDKTGRFVFINPHDVAAFTTPMSKSEITIQSQRVSDVFTARAQDEVLFLAPYLHGAHWMLIVIDPCAPKIYYLDPLNGDPKTREQMMELFNQAVVMFRAGRGLKLQTSNSKLPASIYKWKTITCPKQPNSIDCGYYVMRFMKDIITHNQTTIPDMYFPDSYCTIYSDAHIAEVREEWAEYVFQHCL